MSEQIKQDDYAFKSREPIQKTVNLKPQGIAVKQMASTQVHFSPNKNSRDARKLPDGIIDINTNRDGAMRETMGNFGKWEVSQQTGSSLAKQPAKKKAKKNEQNTQYLHLNKKGNKK